MDLIVSGKQNIRVFLFLLIYFVLFFLFSVSLNLVSHGTLALVELGVRRD